MQFSHNLKDLCQEFNLNIKQLAKLVNIQDSLLYKYINEKSTPSIDNLIKIANFFDCTLDYLAGLDTEIKAFQFTKNYDKSLFFKRYSEMLAQNNISNHALSKELGFSPAELKHWKSGRIPYLETLIKIANYFGISIDYLVGRAD